MLKKIKTYIPQNVKKNINYLYFSLIDIMNFLLGKSDPMIPPKRKIFIGDGDFQKIGNEFIKYFVELCSLKPNDSVLDVGCGIGRMTVPLTKYLNSNAVYEGIDIVESGIDWCREKISVKFKNFNFQLADIYNKTYNPNGRFKACEYKFPYNDESFNFIFLISVFTHMLPDDIDNYLSQISRVLKKNGNCLITFFLLNDESEHCIHSKKSKYNFQHKFNGFYSINKNEPELAIGYDESNVFALFEKYNLKIKKIYYGSWCGRKEFLSFQDIIIVSKV